MKCIMILTVILPFIMYCCKRAFVRQYRNRFCIRRITIGILAIVLLISQNHIVDILVKTGAETVIAAENDTFSPSDTPAAESESDEEITETDTDNSQEQTSEINSSDDDANEAVNGETENESDTDKEISKPEAEGTDEPSEDTDDSSEDNLETTEEYQNDSTPINKIALASLNSIGISHEISDLASLEAFRDAVNSGSADADGSFKLTADIDMSQKYGEGKQSWIPIGNNSHQFTGSFDGGGHKITGLYINVTSEYQGLFGCVGGDGIIENLGVNGSIFGAAYVGGIAGCITRYAAIKNCHYSGTVSGGIYIGGIVGTNDGDGSIENCYNNAAIMRHGDYLGGIVGRNNRSGIIKNCYNTGDIVEGSTYCGGIAGQNHWGTIENCYNTGAVSCRTIYSGGIAGACGIEYQTITKGGIKNCYNFGTVSCNLGCKGGIAGYVFFNEIENKIQIENCYYLNGTADGGIDSTDVNGSAERKTNDEFKSLASVLGDGWADDPVLGRPVLTANKESDVSETLNASDMTINTPDDLETFRDNVNKGIDYSGHTVTLAQDIDLSDTEWKPIGVYIEDPSSYNHPFNGIFEGGGHKITGLTVNSGQNGQGFFAYIGGEGIVQNLNVCGTVSGGTFVGGVVGRNEGQAINCSFNGTVTGAGHIGGIVGDNRTLSSGHIATVSKCYNIGTVSGGNTVGGVVGYNYGTIEDCYNTGTVTGTSSAIGGVSGYMGFNDGKIVNCYNIGGVSGSANVGGIIGDKIAGNVNGCYYLDSCVKSGSGNSEGNGIPLSDFAVQDTFQGWDFINTWKIDAALGRPVINDNKEVSENKPAGGGETNPGSNGNDSNGGDSNGDSGNGDGSSGSTSGKNETAKSNAAVTVPANSALTLPVDPAKTKTNNTGAKTSNVGKDSQVRTDSRTAQDESKNPSDSQKDTESTEGSQDTLTQAESNAGTAQAESGDSESIVSETGRENTDSMAGAADINSENGSITASRSRTAVILSGIGILVMVGIVFFISLRKRQKK